MIFTADNQDIVIDFTLQSDVVIRIACVPVKRTRHRGFRNAHSDHVCDIRRLLRVDRDAIVNRSIRRDNNYVAGHDRTMTRLDPSLRASLDLRRVCLIENTTIVTHDRFDHTVEILEWMKLRLSWEAQSRACIE